MSDAATIGGLDEGSAPVWFVVREMTQSVDRDAALALLGDNPAFERGVHEGEARVFAACDPAACLGQAVMAAAVVVPRADGVVEVCRIAVASVLMARDPVKSLLGSMADTLRAEGWRAMVAIARPDDAEGTCALRSNGFRPVSAPTPAGDVCFELEL